MTCANGVAVAAGDAVEWATCNASATANATTPGIDIGPDANRLAVLSSVLVAGALLMYLGTKQPKEDENMRIRDMPEGFKPVTEADKQAVAAYEARQELPLVPWVLRNTRWLMASYITTVHVLAVVSLPLLLECHNKTLLGMLAFYCIGGFGITGGAHRLWSHKAYKAHGLFRFMTMICNSIANQGTIYHWSRDHRTHHKYSETKADPHNALRGFFFAHVGWLLFKKDPRVTMAGREISMADLAALPEVQLQKRLDPVWNLFWCFLFPGIVGHLWWGESLYTGVMLMGVLRYVLCLNGTWLVNSAAHLYGGHPYDEHSNPSENPAVSIISMGEGWHNWHHAFPHDYAASELGVSSQINPTKLIIDTAALFGLVWGRRRALDLWAMRRKNNKLDNVGLAGPPLLRQRVVLK